jgi:hypothetical protein
MGVVSGASRPGASGVLGSPTREMLAAFDGLPRRRKDDDAQATIRHLQTALESRVVIEQAKGILAERFQISIDDAFNLLRDAARASRKHIHLLAQTVITQPNVTTEEIVASLARPDRWQASVSRIDSRPGKHGSGSANLGLQKGTLL